MGTIEPLAQIPPTESFRRTTALAASWTRVNYLKISLASLPLQLPLGEEMRNGIG